jgi:hypothetical protein
MEHPQADDDKHSRLSAKVLEIELSPSGMIGRSCPMGKQIRVPAEPASLGVWIGHIQSCYRRLLRRVFCHLPPATIVMLTDFRTRSSSCLARTITFTLLTHGLINIDASAQGHLSTVGLSNLVRDLKSCSIR